MISAESSSILASALLIFASEANSGGDGFVMAKKSSEYSEAEAQRRFEQALKGAAKAKAKPPAPKRERPKPKG